MIFTSFLTKMSFYTYPTTHNVFFCPCLRRKSIQIFKMTKIPGEQKFQEATIKIKKKI